VFFFWSATLSIPLQSLFLRLFSQAVKDVSGSQDILVDLFNRIEYFFRRLEIYTEVPPTSAMTDIIIQIMVEVLLIVAMVTKELKRGQLSESIAHLFAIVDLGLIQKSI